MFCLLAALFTSKGIKNRNAALSMLQHRLSEMQNEYLLAMQDKEDMMLQIASQDDPTWVELILLREMGVVPEGFLKVHFKH